VGEYLIVLWRNKTWSRVDALGARRYRLNSVFDFRIEPNMSYSKTPEHPWYYDIALQDQLDAAMQEIGFLRAAIQSAHEDYADILQDSLAFVRATRLVDDTFE